GIAPRRRGSDRDLRASVHDGVHQGHRSGRHLHRRGTAPSPSSAGSDSGAADARPDASRDTRAGSRPSATDNTTTDGGSGGLTPEGPDALITWGGLDGPPKPPTARTRPGVAVALLDVALLPGAATGR